MSITPHIPQQQQQPTAPVNLASGVSVVGGVNAPPPVVVVPVPRQAASTSAANNVIIPISSTGGAPAKLSAQQPLKMYCESSSLQDQITAIYL